MAEGIEGLQAEIRGMSENIAHMRVAVDSMAQELRKVAVLEEKHNGHDASLKRAFSEIKRVEDELDLHKLADVKEHDGFKKAIWFTSGMACAVSILWTVFGIYMVDVVRENIKAVAQIQAHTTDKSMHVDQK